MRGAKIQTSFPEHSAPKLLSSLASKQRLCFSSYNTGFPKLGNGIVEKGKKIIFFRGQKERWPALGAW